MPDRIDEGLRWLSAEFSCTRDEFGRGLRSILLLDSLVSLGYVRHDKRQDRYSVTDRGRRRLAASDAAIGVEE